MKKYQTDFKLEVVKSFLAGEGGVKLLAEKHRLIGGIVTAQLLGVSSVPSRLVGLSQAAIMAV